MTAIPNKTILDISISRVCNPADPDCDVHYETFGRLTEFFGRTMPAHRHSQCYQVHLLLRGAVRLDLDQQFYCGEAPLIYLTPPAVPHTFYSDEGTDGHVLTVRQDVVRSWYAAMPGQWSEAQLRAPAFLSLGKLPARHQPDVGYLMTLAQLIKDEFQGMEKGRSSALLALAECFFIVLNRLIAANADGGSAMRERGEDLRIFLRFCDLIEIRFREHFTLSQYAAQLAVTEARLNEICWRIAQLSSKKVVHDRLLQEARRLLRFSNTPVSEISYQLGFVDPAYFSRFFTQRTGMAPKQFRIQYQEQSG